MATNVIQKILPIGHPNRPQRENKPIAVIIHYTGNDSPTATALANVNYAGREYIKKDGNVYEANGVKPFKYGAGHYYISENEAYQVVPLNEYVAGAGDARLQIDNGYNGQTKIAHDVFNHRQNYMSIQYEICNNGDWNKACDNAINIIAQDMIEYNIPLTNIYRHFDLSGKICPKPFVDDITAWENFKKKLIKKVNELKGITTLKDTLEYLTTQKIIDSPDYWLSQISNIKSVPYLLDFILKIVNAIKDKKEMTLEDSIKILADKEIINSPDYWVTQIQNIKNIKYLDQLIIKLVKGVK